MVNLVKILVLTIVGIWGGTIIYTNDVQIEPQFPENVRKVANGMFWYRMIVLICLAYVLSIISCTVTCMLLAGGGMEGIREFQQ